MPIQRMDHFTIVTDRLDETLAFYAMLGLHAGARPNFGVPGAWLYAAEKPILHVIEVGTMPQPRRGALDHMAYHAKGLLPEPERDCSGYRRYDAGAVVELIRIRTLAEAGVPRN